MDQISKTVNTFLAYIVGIGLICFFSFVFLLASARLNNSTLGNLLASSAGETARMARSESFSFWGDVGQQVASGLGVSSAIGSVTANYPIITPVAARAPTAVPAAPAAPPTSVPAQAPATTPVPVTYIHSSPLSEGGLLRWQGLEADGSISPQGVNMESVRDQASLALQQNSGDLLALWLMSKYRTCQPYLNNMRANFADTAQIAIVRQGADDVVSKCNPRVNEAYARKRWADLVAWASQPTPDDASGAALLKGLTLAVGSKIDGPAREVRAQDHVPISFPPQPEYNFPGATFTVTVGLLTQALGPMGPTTWQLNGGPYTVPGELVPANLPMPGMPTDAELTPPLAAAANKTVLATAQPTNPGKYVVLQGDTVYSIARKFSVTPDALITANPSTLGYNPNYITPGMELNIPTDTP